MKNLGTKLASIATPIAQVMHLSCIDPETQELIPESPCAAAKTRLNAGEPFWDVIYDRFWRAKRVDETSETIESKTNMEPYLVNKTTTEAIAVNANSMDEAEEKVMKGEGEILSRNKTISARPRPTPTNNKATLTG